MSCNCPPKVPSPAASIFGELGALVPLFTGLLEGAEQKKRNDRDFAAHARAVFSVLDPQEAMILAAAAAGHEAVRAVRSLGLAPPEAGRVQHALNYHSWYEVAVSPWDRAALHEIAAAVRAARGIAETGSMSGYIEAQQQKALESVPPEHLEQAKKNMPQHRSKHDLFLDNVFQGVVAEVIANCQAEESEEEPKNA